MMVSIITVCFNSEKTISRTIESVLNQTYDDIEYIIIDGCSTDKTVDVAKKYLPFFEKRGYKYKIISEKDNGIYDAMNKGIKNSSGDIIGIINSDDWYEPNAVSTCVATYNKSNFDYFFADLRIFKRNGKSFIKHSKISKFITTRHWNHPTSFVTKKTYEKYGTFKCKGLYDDLDFYLRMRKAKVRMAIDNSVLANFVVGGASHKKTFNDMKYRFHDKYRCYKDNHFSKLYVIECLIMELAKYILS